MDLKVHIINSKCIKITPKIILSLGLILPFIFNFLLIFKVPQIHDQHSNLKMNLLAFSNILVEILGTMPRRANRTQKNTPFVLSTIHD